MTSEPIGDEQAHLAAVAKSLNLTPEQMEEGLRNIDAAQARLQAAEARAALVRRLQRQGRQFDHAANTATTEVAKDFLRQQHTFIRVIATLGTTPASWEDLAKDLVEVNVEMLATFVAGGLASLPPAEADHE